MSEQQQREPSIGALWQKKTQGGEDYFTGSIEINGTTHAIVVFANRYKQEDKHPDWKILKARPKESR